MNDEDVLQKNAAHLNGIFFTYFYGIDRLLRITHA
jgi:hypothetical protein